MHHLVGVAEIAEMLGVSKQRVVQLAQSYSDFPGPEAELGSGRIWARSAIETWLATHPERKSGPKGGNIPMLENFTSEARRAFARAQAEAVEWGHNYLGCEHLIIGLAASEGIASKALAEADVTPQAAATQLGSIIGRGSGEQKVQAFTPRLKRAGELAAEAAREFGHNYVGPEHILIGILREGDNVGCRLLTDLGVDLDRLRFRTLELMGFPQPSGFSDAITSVEPTDVSRVVELLESMNERLESIESHLGSAG
jgi:predicted DNA-binding transcriptional regulator AlpA